MLFAKIMLLAFIIFTLLGSTSAENAPRVLNYPIRLAYLNRVTSWWGANVLRDLGVPGHTPSSSVDYNVILLGYWTCGGAPHDVAQLWASIKNWGVSGYGSTTQQIQTNLRNKYNDDGMRVLVSAFGSYQHPNSGNTDGFTCGQDLANFVKANNLDGALADWDDNAAIKMGTGQQWLIDFTKGYRNITSYHILAHAPQAAYFSSSYATKGGYTKVNTEVGLMIDFYQVEFYNQNATKYDSYTELFTKTTVGDFPGTSVQEIHAKGIPLWKIVVGKPVLQSDAGSGWVKATDLGLWAKQAYETFGWYAGFGFWKYSSDFNGQNVRDTTGQLINLCLGADKCKGTSPIVTPPIDTTPISNQTNTTNNNGGGTAVDNPVGSGGSGSSGSGSDSSSSGSSGSGSESSSSSGSSGSGNNATTPVIPTTPTTLSNLRTLSYPLKVAYIDKLLSWSNEGILKGLGIPGYATQDYNYIMLAFWSCAGSPMDIAYLWSKIGDYYLTGFGTTTAEVQQNIRKKYHQHGVRLLISAFGATEFPTTQGLDAKVCGKKLAQFVIDNHLDGADADWQDNSAMEAGKGEQWLIDFTNAYREVSPDTIFAHAPQAPYFSATFYKNGGYNTVDQSVGQHIDFYFVQYYNQGNTKYDSYTELFTKTTQGTFPGTSVKQVASRGVPLQKIVVGKPITPSDATNTGWVAQTQLGAWGVTAFDDFGWNAGFGHWQYSSDPSGKAIRDACGLLETKCAAAGKCNATGVIEIPDTGSGSAGGIVPDSGSGSSGSNSGQGSDSGSGSDSSSGSGSGTAIDTPVSGGSSGSSGSGGSGTPTTPVTPGVGLRKINYPIRIAYVDTMTSWWGKGILQNFGVPGFASSKSTDYNYIMLAFWFCGTAPMDAAQIWVNFKTSGMDTLGLGSTNSDIQKAIRKKYNDAGIKILVSAFGATQFPTTRGMNATDCGKKLGQFVIDNNLDGADADWQDNKAMERGQGQQWLIDFTKAYRSVSPDTILAHAPQAPYFHATYYKNGGYNTVQQQVGSMIDFYFVQFYNQEDSRYNSYTELFFKATGFFSGTSVSEIASRGVNMQKLVVGKPIHPRDAYNTGWVNQSSLGAWSAKAYDEIGWYGGVGHWQYKSDLSGQAIRDATGQLIAKCVAGGKCTAENAASGGSSSGGSSSGQSSGDSSGGSSSGSSSGGSSSGSSGGQSSESGSSGGSSSGSGSGSGTAIDTPISSGGGSTTTPTTPGKYDLSLFYCGFGKNFCGQSTTDDVHPGTKFVILAFVNTQSDGSVVMDQANFPHGPYSNWKQAGMQVLISAGGQNGQWGTVFSSTQSITNFVNSLVDIVKRFNLDGVDIDIQYYGAAPRKVADMIIELKKKLIALGGTKIVTVAPECVTVYQAMGVPNADTGAGYYNYFVPIINIADDYIDYYQPQAYNNWYQYPSGSVEFLQNVYLNWRNMQGMTPWGSKPIADFKGVAGQKLLMGVLASTSAGGAAYLYAPDVIEKFKSWLQQKNYPMAGFMMWDSHWDTLNNRLISNAILN